MRLAVFSDPHVDIQEKRGYPRFLQELNEYLTAISPDIILVTGDVGGSSTAVQNFLEGINTDARYKLFVPGNHDIWVNSKSHDGSWYKYYHILPKMCSMTGWHYLPNNPIVIKNVGFAGSIGWYNYTSRNQFWDEQVDLETYKLKINPSTGARWMDREFAKFGNYTDRAIADHFLGELGNDINRIVPTSERKKINMIPEIVDEFKKNMNSHELKNQSNIETLVVGTHIVPFLDFVKFAGKLEWDYFSAYIGNKDLGELINNIDSRLRRIAVFGHTHFSMEKKDDNNLEAFCCPIGYPHEWERKHHDIKDLFDNKIQLLTI